MEAVDTAAPAQSTPNAPETASQAALQTHDLSAYREARQAERITGTPAPEQAETPKAAAPVKVDEPVRQTSKRQHEINERIRKATELALDQDRAARGYQAPPAPSSNGFPAYADYLTQNPDASLETYIDARQDYREQSRVRQTAAQRDHEETIRTQATRLTTAQERIADARQTDRVLDKMITDWSAPGATVPDVLLISTREKAIADRIIPRPEHDFASEIVKSEYYPQLLRHLVEHPDTIDRVKACETRGDVIKLVGRLEKRFEADDEPVIQTTHTVTKAPPPPTTVSTRNAQPANSERAAVNAGNFGSYRANRLAARRAAQG